MSNVATIFARKGGFNHLTIDPEGTVLEALKIMADNNVGSVVVRDSEKYHGIFTERNYSRNVILKDRHSHDTKVKDVMTIDLPQLKMLDTLDHCMQTMSDYNVQYLPVTDGTEMIGVISIKDLIREQVHQQKELVKYLKNYISG
ncbi:CBS domain-containing protein [Chryseobacterium suipulveris]|uniref:CBS domain-containing protein n=1 Tax=Chryseobacterium suipulveris TaxID=2929800 RepID=A0ABY4BNN2_9FLAO|nr:CBS domain-containing protein [Chryseobacterium suipulveris]UOE40394.1 CBS domain-containing protein [Chryseobacterium suipulveris]